MIHFEEVEAPNGWEEVKKKGDAWLKANPTAKRPTPLWCEYAHHLSTGFHELCAYQAIHEPKGTVDHFLPFVTHPHKAYEWSNYRNAAGWINSSKKKKGYLDPYTIKDTWFELLLPSLLVKATDEFPAEFEELAKNTLELVNSETAIRIRTSWYELYRCGDLSLGGLEKRAPMIARAIQKGQNR